jgi:hypothetical protein
MDSLGFNFLRGAARCFVFRVEVVRGSGVAVILFSALVVRDLACPFAP